MTIWQWAVCGFLICMADDRLETHIRIAFGRTPREVKKGEERDVILGLVLFALLFGGVFALCGYLWNL